MHAYPVPIRRLLTVLAQPMRNECDIRSCTPYEPVQLANSALVPRDILKVGVVLRSSL
jgi:hypothetical protein